MVDASHGVDGDALEGGVGKGAEGVARQEGVGVREAGRRVGQADLQWEEEERDVIGLKKRARFVTLLTLKTFSAMSSRLLPSPLLDRYSAMMSSASWT